MYANGRLEGKQEATSSSWKSVIFSRIDGVICHKLFTLINIMGTRWSSWLRHCATSRKVMGLEFFIDKILPAAPWLWDRLSLYEKWVPGILLGE